MNSKFDSGSRRLNPSESANRMSAVLNIAEHGIRSGQDRESMAFPLNELRQLTNDILAQPNVNGISIELLIPNCPNVNLTLKNIPDRQLGNWEVDPSKLNISGEVSGALTDQDVYEILHEIGHVYARHALQHSPSGVFAEIAVLKEERWCWEFALDVGLESGLISSKQEFWEVSTDLGLTYVTAMVNHVKNSKMSSEHFRLLLNAPEVDSTPPHLMEGEAYRIAQSQFGNIRVW